MMRILVPAVSRLQKLGILVGLLLLAGAASGWLVLTPDSLGPVGAPLLPPFSKNAWLGTDQLGRSIAFQTWHGGATTLGIGAAATVLTMVVGVVAGCSAAMLPSHLQSVIKGVIKVWQSIPPILAVLAISMAMPLTGFSQVAAIAAACWAGIARVTFAEVTGLMARPYVMAAHALGAGRWHIFWHTLMPNFAPLLATLTAVTAALALTLQSSVAFLGLDSGDITWGAQIGRGQRYVLVAWWMVVPPSLCLLIAIGSIMLISLGTSTPGSVDVRANAWNRFRSGP